MSILGYPFGWIMWAIYQVVNNYGIALILFTVFFRLILFPLSIKQQKSSAKMQVFQPKIEEIQKKYANNKEKQQEELMKLYESHGYNPMGGCLPSIIQLVLLFGVIYVVYDPLTHILRLPSETITALTDIVTAQLGNQGVYNQLAVISAIQNPDQIGWFSSISSDIISQIQNFDYTLFGIYLGSIPTWNSLLVIIPILSGLTSFLTSFISMKMTPGMNQQSGMMKGMMYGMPLFSLFIAFSVPVGVAVYWIAGNLLRKQARHADRKAQGMEKTRCRLNICGVEVTVSGDMDRAAAERIAEAVRSRMQQVLNTAYAASIEKAAVITAMNLCEELARQEAALRQSEEKAAQLEEELRQLGGAEGLRARLQQAEGKLKLAEEQIKRLQAQPAAAQPAAPEKPAGQPVPMRNPLRPDIGEQEGLVSFFAKE